MFVLAGIGLASGANEIASILAITVGIDRDLASINSKRLWAGPSPSLVCPLDKTLELCECPKGQMLRPLPLGPQCLQSEMQRG